MSQQLLHSQLPSRPGVYLFKDKGGKIIYVGKAKDLKKRVSSYFSKALKDFKTTSLLKNIIAVDYIIVNSEIEAFLLEANLIKKHKPFYNIKFSDDKFYPYVKISSVVAAGIKDKIPYIVITRNKDTKEGTYFGPYPNVESLKIVLKLMRKLFPFQSVKNHPKKNCLYYHLNQCPCIPLHPENLEGYKKNIRNLISFLDGKKVSVIKNLKKEQKEFIKKEEFEKAKTSQTKIEKIELITSEQYDPFRYMERPNLYYERVAEEVKSLGKILGDYNLEIGDLRRIECYDISNFSGKEATGSMVVFINGDSAKSEYRKFKIRLKSTPDDFFMHQEMMSRRIRHLEDWGMPNLLVIDGGKGQVSSILKILVRHNISIPVVGLAKRIETIVIPYKPAFGSLEFIEVNLPHSTPGINLLRRIRDEAHRFAITYHRLLRKKKTFA